MEHLTGDKSFTEIAINQPKEKPFKQSVGKGFVITVRSKLK